MNDKPTVHVKAGNGVIFDGRYALPNSALFDVRVEQSAGGPVELVLRVACSKVVSENAEGDQVTFESHT